MQKNRKIYNAIMQQEEDGGYIVSVPCLPGCFSQGDTFEEAVKNIQEAIELYLEDEKSLIFDSRSKNEFMVPISLNSHYA